jgi:hypothetical protein
MKYIKKLNIDFDNWDNIHSNKYWYLNCYTKFGYNIIENNIFISYIDIDNNKKRNNKIEILYQDIIDLKKINFNTFINSKKISFNSFVDINKVGSKIFKINNNDIYYLISNKDNISLSDISDELLINFKKECKYDIKYLFFPNKEF